MSFWSAAALAFFTCLAQAETSVIICEEMLDVREGRILKDMRIEIQDGKITKVEKATKSPAAIRLAGQICMPGWIDTHIHFEQELPHGMNSMDQPDETRQTIDSFEFPKRDLLAGFTTVRDLASVRNTAVEFRTAVNQKKMIGPRILATRAPLSAPGGHGDFFDEKKPGWNSRKRAAYLEYYGLNFVTSKADVDTWFKTNFDDRPEWRKQFKRTSNEDTLPDAIKVMATGGVVSPTKHSYGRQLSEDLIRHIVLRAKEYSQKIGRPLPVAAHAHGIDGILDAAAAGVDSIEHATELGGPIRDDLTEEELKKFNDTHAEAVRKIRENKVRIVPTLEAADSVVHMAENNLIPPNIKEKALMIGPKMLKNFSKVVQLDLPMAFGTDTGVSNHGQNWKEFVLLVEKAGMPAMKAFQLATIESAKLLRRDKEFGALEPGLSADIVALPKGVMKDIRLTEKVSFVMKEGTIYKKNGRAVN